MDGLAVVDLHRRAQELRSRPDWRHGSAMSDTVVREGPLRVQLSTLRRGARLGANTADGPIAIMVVEGTAVIDRGGLAGRLKPGEIAVLTADGPWALVAELDSVLVLSVFAQPPEPADTGTNGS